ncbi:hypothetical protein [Polycladidibacter stylochi]|uniref:hypothetical protein n=1 Tax=Polycladidibacter stylochi TaxID=1807766 RepID=UPI0008301514|nr:hypothetical protein [Pseudovibrio stylochi]
MGYRGDYLLIKQSPERIASALDLTVLNKAESVPHSGAWIGRLKNGWTVFVVDHAVTCDLQENAIRALSKGTCAITCSVNETVMSSQASGYVDGLTKWQITNTLDAACGEEALEEQG